MRFESIQALRALAANVVLAAHMTAIEQKYGAGTELLPDWIGVSGGISGVSLFFVISGFVIAIACQDARCTDFLRARIVRIYPIYWFYTTLVVVVFLVRPEIVNQSYVHPASILKSYLLWPEEVLPILGVGWTLIHEMYFYLVVTAVIALAIPLAYALPAWSCVVLAAPFVVDVTHPATAIIFHPMTLEFIGGASIGLIILKGAARFGKAALLAGISLLVLGFTLYNLGLTPSDDRWARLIYLGLPFIPIVYGVAAMERRRMWHTFPLVLDLGDASYSIYLSHTLTISVLGRMFAAQPLHNSGFEFFFVIVCIMAANTNGILSYRYLELPTLSFLRKRRAVIIAS